MLELDSVSLSFITQNLDCLPTMKKLLDAGDLIETGTTADLASASVWPTFASGKLPGEHGHYFPFQWHAGDMRYYRSYRETWDGMLTYKPFWYDLARNGVDCLVFDVSQSYPHTDSPCLEISDWSTQSSGKAMSSDPAVLNQLRKQFGKRPIGAEVPVLKSRQLSSSLRKQLLRSLKQKADSIIWLGQSRKWQFYLASIHDVHRAGHNLWPVAGEFASDAPPDALREVYSAMDKEIARILDVFKDENTTVLVFTLSGMAPNRAQNHFLPQVLNRLNRLYLTGERPDDISTSRDGIMAKLRDLLPASLQYTATRVLGQRIQDWVVNREFTGGLDWSRSPSFPVPSGGEGLIRLSLKGREREGVLSFDDGSRQRYVNWLRKRIMNIRIIKTGESLVKEFIEVHNLYPGDHSHLLPDIALKWTPRIPATAIHSDDIGTIEKKLLTGRGGNHTGESFAVISGRKPAPEIISGLNHIKDYKDIVTALLGPVNTI